MSRQTGFTNQSRKERTKRVSRRTKQSKSTRAREAESWLVMCPCALWPKASRVCPSPSSVAGSGDWCERLRMWRPLCWSVGFALSRLTTKRTSQRSSLGTTNLYKTTRAESSAHSRSQAISPSITVKKLDVTRTPSVKQQTKQGDGGLQESHFTSTTQHHPTDQSRQGGAEKFSRRTKQSKSPRESESWLVMCPCTLLAEGFLLTKFLGGQRRLRMVCRDCI